MPPALFVPSTPAPTHPGRFRSVLPLGNARVGGAFLTDQFGPVGRQAIEMAFGADLRADPETWVWYDVTRYAQWRNMVNITSGRADESSRTSPSSCTFDLRDDNGDFNTNNVYGAYYPDIGVGVGVPVRCRLDVGAGWSTRFQGYTSGMTPGWDTSRNFAYVSVAAKGESHRLEQGSKPLQSAPYRYLSKLTGVVPVAAWTLEEGPLVSGGQPMYGDEVMAPFVGSHPSGAVISYPRWGSGQLAPWLPSVVSRSGSGGLTALWAAVSMPAFTTTWTVDFAYTSGSDGSISTVDVNPSYLDGALGWPQLTLDPGAGTVAVSFDGSPETTTSVTGLYDSLVHHVRWTATQVSTHVDWTVYVDSVSVNTGTELTFTLPAITTISLVTESGSADVANGYVAVWTTPPAVADYTDAVQGHTGETPTDRLARLGAEEGVDIQIFGTSRQTMGAQSTDAFTNLLRDCEAVDNGLLYDGFGPGYSYTSLDTLYNAGATFVLDAAAGQVLPDFAPVGDDQRIRNRWYATRPGGGNATHEVTDGRLGTGKVNLYDSSASVNVDSDDDVEQQASWRGRLGTAESARFPRLVFNLAKSPQLAARWLTTRLFQRVDVTNVDDVFTKMPSVLAQQVLQGYSERWNSKTWEVTANGTPFEPYVVAIYDTSRYASDGSFLSNAVSTTATSWLVTTPSGPLWRPTQTGGTGVVAAPWVGTSVSGAGGGTSTTMDISGATDDEWVFVAIGVGDSQASAPTAPAGWTITGQVQEGASGASSSCFTVYQRKKVTGDTTFVFSWPTTRKFEAVVLSWPGLDPTTPVESVATLAHSAASASYVTGTVTPTSTDRWIAQFSCARGVTALETFTPDAAMTERVDANHAGTSPFVAIQVADTNAAVTAAGHTYTATCSQADPNGSVIAFALIPESSTPVPFEPYDLWCDGEVVTVTDIAAATNPQTFTVTRSVNGIVKGHKDYREVALYPQPRYAL